MFDTATMKQLVYSCAVMFALMAGANALSCVPCNRSECTFNTSTCGGGIVLDVCGCCDVCAKLAGEKCGGPWNINGLCDTNLTCYKSPRDMGNLGGFNADGTCIRGNSDLCPSPKNYSECASECPRTCNNVTGPTGPCILSCAWDPCVCEDGYVMYSVINRTCVREDECPDSHTPDVCPGVKVFNSCPTIRPRTCEDELEPDVGLGPSADRVCDTDRCVCPEGHVFRSRLDRTCIPDEECARRRSCRFPKKFAECATECPETCNGVPEVCTFNCAEDACLCEEGYVMHSRINRTCIQRSDCPGNATVDECPDLMEFNRCPPMNPRTCDDPIIGDILGFRECDVDRCVCQEGYVFESFFNKTCVKETECEETCKFPKFRDRCSSACQPTCNEPVPQICTEQCVDQCVCSTGWIRRSATDHSCIRNEECPTKGICEYPKTFMECATACPPTCDNPNPTICTRNCNIDPCVCPPDHVMRSLEDRTCIHEYECPERACMKACPPLDFTSSCGLAEAWVCELSNWRCSTYQWKLQVEEWWYNECWQLNEMFYGRWQEALSCPEKYLPVDCVNPATQTCDFDAFGCRLCQCTDGRYRDTRQLMAVYKWNFERFQSRMQVFKEAVAACKEFMGDNAEPSCP